MILFFICFFFCLFLATPVLYALLNDKKAHTYTLLFRALKRQAKEMKMKFEPDKIISDFETGIISTVKKEVSACVLIVTENLVHVFFFLIQLPNTIH
jgi:hypothetical protein